MTVYNNSKIARLNDFGQWVSSQAKGLIGISDEATPQPGGYLGNNPRCVAAIAKLARAVGHDIGDDPDIFTWIIPDIDDDRIYPYPWSAECREGTPTHAEYAAHTALTLMAIHQQSNHDKSVHTDAPISLGYAVGAMAYGNFNEKGIRSTFDKLQTASSWSETTMHARRLVKLLKREDAVLNYGLFAQDLINLRVNREQANKTRLRWGRDYLYAYNRAQRSESEN